MSEKRKLNRTPLETKDQIIALYRQGYNGVQIDQKLGLGKGTAGYHIGKYKKGHKAPELISQPTTMRPDTIAVSIVSEKKPTEEPKNYFGPKMTQEQKNKLVDLYVLGNPYVKIAKEVGCHFTTPGQYIKKLKERKLYKKETAKACKRVGISKPVAKEVRHFHIAGANKNQQLPLTPPTSTPKVSVISEIEKLRIENELMKKLIIEGKKL